MARWQLPARAEDGHHLVAHPTKPLLAVTQFGYPGLAEGLPKLTVWLLDTTTGKLASTLQAPVDLGNRNPGGSKESPTGLAFSPDGRWLVMSARSGRLHRWDLSGSTPGPVTTWSARGSGGVAVFTPSGGILCAQGGYWLQVWDTRTWKEIAARELGPELRSITPLPLTDQLAVAVDGRVRFLDPYDLSDLRPTIQARGVGTITVGPDGRTGVMADGHEAAVIDLAAGLRAGVIGLRGSSSGGTTPVASPDGRFVAVSGAGRRGVGLYDLGSGRWICDLPVPDRDGSPPVTFSGDGGRLYVGGRNEVRVYELAGNRVLALRPNPVGRFGTSPDGRTMYLATGATAFPWLESGELTAWSTVGSLSAPRAAHPHPFGGTGDGFTALARHPTGPWVAGGYGDRGFVWNVANGTLKGFALSLPPRERMVGFGPSDRLWVGGDKAVALELPGLIPAGAEYADPLVRALRGRGAAGLIAGCRTGVLAADCVGGLAWLDGDGRPRAKWKAGDARVSAVSLSPDERTALVGLESGDVGLFRLPSGDRIAAWKAHAEMVTAACWLSPSEFAVGSADQLITLWRFGAGAPERLFAMPTTSTVCDLATVAGGRLAILESGARAVRVVDLSGIVRELRNHRLGVGLLGEAGAAADPVVPFWSTRAADRATGARVAYFAYNKITPVEMAHILTRDESEIGGDWGAGAPHPAVPPDHFRVVYRGWLKAPVAGKYTLHVEADDEAQVYLDGHPVGKRVLRGRGDVELVLTGRPHRLRIEYVEEIGDARLRVRWSGPGGLIHQPLGSALLLDPFSTETAVNPSVGTTPR